MYGWWIQGWARTRARKLVARRRAERGAPLLPHTRGSGEALEPGPARSTSPEPAENYALLMTAGPTPDENRKELHAVPICTHDLQSTCKTRLKTSITGTPAR